MVGKKILGFISLSSLLTMSLMALDLPANKLVDSKWLEANKNDKSLIIVDIREDGKAYKKSHIPGAIHWSTKDFREERYKGLPGFVPSPLKFTRLMKKSGITKDSNIVFYSDGKEKDSYTIAGLGIFLTEYFGFKNTAILNGGFASWEALSLPVEDKKGKNKKSDWKISSFKTSIVSTVYNIDEAVELGNIQLLDSRKTEQFTGEKKHKKVKKGGHLPGAKHLFVGNFTKEKDGVLYIVDKKTAVKEFEKAKVDLSKPVIWYCNSGWYASGAWFVGKYVAGIKDSKVYDGSMIEYTSLPKRKVEKEKK